MAKKTTKKKTTKKKTTKKKTTKGSSNADKKLKLRDLIKQDRKPVVGRVNPVVVFESDSDQTPRVPTRFTKLNMALGGIKKGAIIEVSGLEDSGKSSFGMALAADIQSRAPNDRNVVIFVNYEGPEAWSWWRTLGVDTHEDNFVQIQPLDLQDGIGRLKRYLDTDTVCAVIIDSVYAASSRERNQQLENWASNSKDGVGIGLEARAWGDAWTSLNRLFKDKGVVCIAINQVREDIDMGGSRRPSYLGKALKTTRGAALRYYSHIRISMRGTALVDEEGKKRQDVDGIKVRMTVIKNKDSDDERVKLSYDLIRGEGFDLVSDLISAAIQAGVIEAKGAGNYYLSGHRIRGKATLYKKVKEEPKIQQFLKAKLGVAD